MRCYTEQHQYYCGIDLHARTVYVCSLGQTGQILARRNLPSESARLLAFIAPYRADIVVAVDCRFT
jgi:hypothetical protein